MFSPFRQRGVENPENRDSIKSERRWEYERQNIKQLIASLCLLFASILNILAALMEPSFILRLSSLPLLAVSIYFYWNDYIKKKNKNDKK